MTLRRAIMSKKKPILSEIIDRTDKRKGKFVIWYCTPQDKRDDFKTFSQKHLQGESWEVVESWLLEPEISSTIRYYMKLQHTVKLKNIYDKMYEQALAGDVQSAKFLMDFSKEFFIDDEDELHKLLSGIEVDEDE